jgi:hypothetical protein
MMRDKNSSVVSIEDDNINGIEETIETNTEESIKPTPDDVPKKKQTVPEQKEEHSITTTSVHVYCSKRPVPSSVPSIDTNPSRKYPITLGQARIRVLRAIMKAKKRNLPLAEDDR